jgi:transcription elongation GreA/GreB family factor
MDMKTPVEQSLKKFEKEILFDTGSYVYHKIWGIGKLFKIEGEDFLLNFDNKVEHRMSYSMALKSLLPLSNEHIWVLKKEKKLENKDDHDSIRRILLNVLRSFPEKALSIDNFKEELVPDVIPNKSWNNWWNKAKNVLKQETTIGTLKDGRPKYILRDIKVKFEEELVNSFFQSKKFDERLKIFEEFTKDSDQLEDFSDFFREMIHYFSEIITATSRFDFNEKLISYILIKKLKNIYGWAITEVPGDVNNFMETDNLLDTLVRNYKNDYKKEIINLIDKYHPNAVDVLEEALWQDKGQLAEYLLEKIQRHLDNSEIKDIIDQSLNNRFKNNPFIAIWFLHYLLKNNNYQDFDYDIKDLYIEILYRIDTVGKLINQKKLNWFYPSLSTPDAKKILNSISNLLFENDKNKSSETEEVLDIKIKVKTGEESFTQFISNMDNKDYILKIYPLIKSSNGLNPKNKNELLKLIIKKFPEIEEAKTMQDFVSYVATDYYDGKYIWSTHAGMDRQIKKMDELKREKEKNLVELEKAREKGDLRENAEYQYAKEKDTNLNNQITYLSKLISQVKIIDTSTINGEQITPGTMFTMERNGKKETYTILGYWDTDEINHVIAYNSPLAKELMSAKKGEEREIELGGQKTKIKVIDIKVAKE